MILELMAERIATGGHFDFPLVEKTDNGMEMLQVYRSDGKLVHTFIKETLTEITKAVFELGITMGTIDRYYEEQGWKPKWGDEIPIDVNSLMALENVTIGYGNGKPYLLVKEGKSVASSKWLYLDSKQPDIVAELEYIMSKPNE